jgi:hypothetical protein
MEFNKLSKDLKELNIKDDTKENVTDKSLKLLDVYFCIDLDKTIQDIDLIKKCLETYIIVHFKEYKLNIFKNVEYKKTEKNDVVKSGLFTFNKIYKDLKLKSLNDVWFIYISNGDIKTEYKNVFVLLLNKNPKEKSSFYVINKNQIDIKKNNTNINKLNELKFLKKTIHELFNTTRSITYTNLIEN